MSTEQEPNDSHIYNWVSFNNDTLHFYLEAIKFYEELLKEDVQAIESDKDLAMLLGERERGEFEIQRELARVQRVRTHIEKKIEADGINAWDYDISMSHGWIRILKSVGLDLLHK